MQTIWQTLNDFKPNNIAAFGFKQVLASFIMTERQLPDKVCIGGIQEDITIELVFCDSRMNDPTILFRVLGDYTSLKSFHCRPHPNTT